MNKNIMRKIVRLFVKTIEGISALGVILTTCIIILKILQKANFLQEIGLDALAMIDFTAALTFVEARRYIRENPDIRVQATPLLVTIKIITVKSTFKKQWALSINVRLVNPGWSFYTLDFKVSIPSLNIRERSLANVSIMNEKTGNFESINREFLRLNPQDIKVFEVTFDIEEKKVEKPDEKVLLIEELIEEKKDSKEVEVFLKEDLEVEVHILYDEYEKTQKIVFRKGTKVNISKM